MNKKCFQQTHFSKDEQLNISNGWMEQNLRDTTTNNLILQVCFYNYYSNLFTQF